jgi:2-keto-4-pentenoate hydratase
MVTTRETLSAMDLLDAYDQGVSIDRTRFLSITDLAQAEALQNRCVEMRLVRGERPLGIKIGFTNRSIWPLYNVTHPIWAPVFRETIQHADNNEFVLKLQRVCEPRLEPEIVLGFKEAVVPTSSSIEDIFAALDWVAHGFEIVQSPFANWKFTAAEAMAAQGLHSKLLIGAKHRIADLTTSSMVFNQWLTGLKITLRCNNQAVATGRGSNVLDSPLQAISHLISELEKRGERLQPGAIVTTGTLTDAMPISEGELWETVFENHSLPNLRLSLAI